MPTSTAFAGGLLIKAGLLRAALQLTFDFSERDASRMEHHEQMVEKIGRFGDDPVAVLGEGGDGNFDRLLAELLGAVRHASIDERPRVRTRRDPLSRGPERVFRDR